MVYLASPFFNKFEIIVKDNMIETVRDKMHLGKDDMFNPEDSDVSNQYGVAGGNAAPEQRFEFARAIYQDNVNGIKKCDTLVFPKFTTDLGTLWEVGFAMGLGKKIYRYNFLTRKLEQVDYKPIEWTAAVRNERNIATTFDAVIFGILSSNEKIAPNLVYSFYEDAELTDNIMFAANFKFKNAEGKVIAPKDRDWTGGIL